MARRKALRSQLYRAPVTWATSRLPRRDRRHTTSGSCDGRSTERPMGSTSGCSGRWGCRWLKGGTSLLGLPDKISTSLSAKGRHLDIPVNPVVDKKVL